MQLYFSPNSPYARKVRIVLKEKGLDCQEIAMSTDSPPPEFAKHNPNLRVPILVDGEHALFESNIIVEYLLKTYPAKSQGQPALAATMTRPDRHWDDMLVLNCIETMLDSGLNIFQLRKGGVDVTQVPYTVTEAKRIRSELEWLEQRATPEGFVPGVFSVQDMNLVCALTWIGFRKPIELPLPPKVSAIMARYKDRPSVASTMPK